MDFLNVAWNYFAGVLSPLGMILLALVVWGEIKAYLTRKRVAVILDAKDLYASQQNERVFTAVEGYVKLTGLLEKVLEKESG